MTPLPPALGGSGAVVGWRLDLALHAETWDSGEGSYRFEGRWNQPGFRMVYASLDPSTALLEVAAHKGFPFLDGAAHVLTAFEVIDPAQVHVVTPDQVPNPRWLSPAKPSAAQRDWAMGLMRAHGFVCLPSVVSPHSWNLIFAVRNDPGHRLIAQERYGLDTRLAAEPV